MTGKRFLLNVSRPVKIGEWLRLTVHDRDEPESISRGTIMLRYSATGEVRVEVRHPVTQETISISYIPAP